MKKGFAHIFLLIVIVLVGIAGIGYFAFKNGHVVTSTQQASTSPTQSDNEVSPSDWKRYTNDFLSYTFSYPPDWELKEGTSQGYSYITISSTKVREDAQKNPGMTEVVRGGIIYLSVQNKDPWYTDRTLKESFPLTGRGGSYADSYTPFSVSGVDGLLFTYENKKGMDFVARDTFAKGFGFERKINQDNLLFEFTLAVINHQLFTKTEFENYLNTFDQILSTFEFIDNSESANFSAFRTECLDTWGSKAWNEENSYCRGSMDENFQEFCVKYGGQLEQNNELPGDVSTNCKLSL